MRQEIIEIEHAYIYEYRIVKEVGRARLVANYRRQDANKKNIDSGGMGVELLKREGPITDDEIFAVLPGKIRLLRNTIKKQIADYPPTIIRYVAGDSPVIVPEVPSEV